MRRRALIILNPSAGRAASSKHWLQRVIAGLERRGIAVVLREAGPAVGDIERLTREAEAAFDIIVAAGGDGTINAAVNALRGNARAFGILPLGSANVVARELGLPRRPEEIADLIADAPARPVWPGRIGDRLFLAMAGCGFDADIVAAVDPRLKRRIGRLAFAPAILGCVVRGDRCTITVRAEGAEYPVAALIATRTRFYAGPFLIAPQAALAEPVLDLVLFRHSGRAASLRYLRALGRGTLPRQRDILFLRCREAEIAAAVPVRVQADGEVIGALPITLGLAEKPLYLVGA